MSVVPVRGFTYIASPWKRRPSPLILTKALHLGNRRFAPKPLRFCCLCLSHWP